MKLLTDWGFTAESWRGTRGEYWVVMQGLLMVGFVLVPVYGPALPLGLSLGLKAIALGLALFALVLLGKGLVDLGQSLTPLPYPREDGQLIQTGMYGIVRHCLYSGIVLMAIAFSLWQGSLSHLAATLVLFFFFDFKARKEEAWLTDKYPDYSAYQQRVKKLLPWIY
ncbi:MAG TPA: isoprenylcysteine carboxylmethyltransferase family protein [Candidatus Obscuribacterales bacterium]